MPKKIKKKKEKKIKKPTEDITLAVDASFLDVIDILVAPKKK